MEGATIRQGARAAGPGPSPHHRGDSARGPARRAVDRVRGGLDRAWEHTWQPVEVMVCAAVLVTLSMALRAWVVVPAYFFLDDYVYLSDARSASPDASWLLTPYNGHLMPGARALIWWVAEQGPASWRAAATTSLGLQAVASASFAWMLLRLFGARAGVLVPLAVFLTTATTLPALVWWAAAINLVAVQAALFCAVACWVETMRTRRAAWLGATVAAVGVGLAFDVRAVLTLPVLAAISFAYFATGGPVQRVAALLRGHALPALSLVALGGAYTAYYVTQVEQVTAWPQPGEAATLLALTLGATLPLGAVGGPWRWTGEAPPTALADVGPLGVVLAWVLLGGVVAWVAARRARTLRGWVIALAHAAVLVVLVAGTRAEVGTAAGREFRFLVESGGLLCLALALALLPLPGAPGGSTPRPRPRVPGPSRLLVVVVTAAVLVGGVASTVGYARHWHHDNASEPYVSRLALDLAALGPVDLAETRTPRAVLDPLVFPRNNTRTLVDALDGPAELSTVSTDLYVVDDDGSVHEAALAATAVTRPGPVAGCGWAARPGEPVTLPFERAVAPGASWMRVAYLAGSDVEVQVEAGGTIVRERLRAGVGSLFLLQGGDLEAVTVDVVGGSSDVCVDRAEVGELVAGAAP